jgi:hypothetical protein
MATHPGVIYIYIYNPGYIYIYNPGMHITPECILLDASRGGRGDAHSCRSGGSRESDDSERVRPAKARQMVHSVVNAEAQLLSSKCR